VSQDLLGQNLAQLDAFLVEGVDVPGEALVHDLVLKVSKQSAHALGGQLLADDNGGGTAAFELLVQVGVILAAGEGHDLGSHVGAELLLAGGALDHHVRAHLAVLEAHELQGDNVGALVQQLIEGVLTVGAGLAEDDGAGDVVHRLAEAVDGLAVGLHVQLLQVSGEAAQSLGVGQHGGVGVAQNIALVNADQSVQQSGVGLQVGVLGQNVSLGSAIQEVCKDLGAEGQAQDAAAHAGGGGETAADVVIHEEGSQIVGRGGQGRGFGGDAGHVVGGVQAGFHQGVLHKGLVGQGLQGGAGLGNQHEQGVGQIQGTQNTCCIVGVHVGNEGGLHLQIAGNLCPVLQSQVDSPGAQVGAADADLADGGELLAGSVDNLACVDLVCKLSDLLLLADIEITLVDVVSDDIVAQLTAAHMVQNQALFTGVDNLAVVQGGELLSQLLLLSELGQNIQNVVIHGTGAVVEVHTCTHGDSVVLHTLCAVLAGHCAFQADLGCILQLGIGSQGVHVFPGDHDG